MKALSVRQPWAWLILHAGKNVENRTWNTTFRGRTLLHTGQGMTHLEYLDAQYFLQQAGLDAAFKALPELKDLPRGGIVGEVEIVDCVSSSLSPWFVGPWGLVLKNPKVLPFRPYTGQLGFFEVTP